MNLEATQKKHIWVLHQFKRWEESIQQEQQKEFS